MKIMILNVLYSKTKDFTRIEYIPLDKEYISNNEYTIGYKVFTAYATGNKLGLFESKDLFTNASATIVERQNYKDPMSIKKYLNAINVNGKDISLV